VYDLSDIIYHTIIVPVAVQSCQSCGGCGGSGGDPVGVAVDVLDLRGRQFGG